MNTGCSVAGAGSGRGFRSGASTGAVLTSGALAVAALGSTAGAGLLPPQATRDPATKITDKWPKKFMNTLQGKISPLKIPYYGEISQKNVIKVAILCKK
jgi:hypothetical protein